MKFTTLLLLGVAGMVVYLAIREKNPVQQQHEAIFRQQEGISCIGDPATFPEGTYCWMLAHGILPEV